MQPCSLKYARCGGFYPFGDSADPFEALSRYAGFGREGKELGVRLLGYSKDWRLRELGDLELRDVCMVFGYSRRIRSPTSSPRGAQDQPQEGSKVDRLGQSNGVIFKYFRGPI